MTTVANPNATGWEAFMGKASGLLTNPMFGMGVGLLQGAMPGGTLGSGLQAGLANAGQMTQANQMSQLRDLQQQQAAMRLEEMQRKQAHQEKLRTQGMPDWIGAPAQEAGQVPYQMSEAELFPGEQAPTGLLTQQEAAPATGMYASNPQMAGLLQQQYEYDPMGTNQAMVDALIEQQATAGQAATQFGYDSMLQAQKDAAAADKPMTVGKGATVYDPTTQTFRGATGAAGGPAELSDVLSLKKQAQPRMDMFRKVAQSGENIKANITRAGAFSDVNTLVSAIKVLDPESVVREGEVALPINTSGLWNELQSKVQQAQGQGFLTDTMKRDIAGSIDALLQTYERAYQDVASEYQPYSEDYGIDAQRIIGNPVTFPRLNVNELFGGGQPAVPGGPGPNPLVDQGMQRYGGQ